MKTRQILSLALSVILCLVALAALLFLVGAPVRAQGSVRYVATTGADVGVCTDPANPCATVQYAVDAAGKGDIIRVATGVYTETQARPSPPGYNGPSIITQVVYISKTITVRGGYSVPDFSDPPDPEAHPTTLDARGQGRVLFVTGNVSPTIEGLQITGGDAGGLGGDPFDRDAGGGVYVDKATATISNCQVFSNTAPLFGGGIYLRSSDGSVRGNVVRNNSTSFWGGGLCLYESGASVSKNLIADNQAVYGGGLALHGSGSIVDGNTIVGNEASHGGGGVEVQSWNTGSIHTHVADNRAGRNSDGLRVYHKEATLINNVIIDNQGKGWGSGLYVYGALARLVHNTIARNNRGDGIGIYLNYALPPFQEPSRVVLTNTILVGHKVGILVDCGDCSARLEATLWGTGTWANGTDWQASSSGSILPGTINIWEDPAFVDPGAGDYHVRLTSAAVDTGVEINVDNDLDGDPRPQGYGYDMGADETGVVVNKRALSPVQSGGWLTYSLYVTNTSDVDVHATITDILPAQTTTTQPLVWTPLIPSRGGPWRETVTVSVDEDVSGPLTNVLRVTTEEGAGGVHTHTLVPDMDVAKWASADEVQPGERLTYTLCLTNTGDFFLHATIADILPAHVTTPHPLVWTPLITAPGGVWEEMLVVTVEKGYAGPLTNTLQVTTDEGAGGIVSVTVRAGYYLYLPLVLRQ